MRSGSAFGIRVTVGAELHIQRVVTVPMQRVTPTPREHLARITWFGRSTHVDDQGVPCGVRGGDHVVQRAFPESALR